MGELDWTDKQLAKLERSKTVELTEREQFMLNHITRWGSDGYPVQKVGSRHWSWAYGNGNDTHSCPVVFRTKKLAVESFENHLEILRDKKAGRI